MIYSDATAHGKQVSIVDVAPQQAQQFSISDAEVEALARQAVIIEQHYGRPMDIEWAKDGIDGKLYIVQARPETVQSNKTGQALERYALKTKSSVVAEGRAIGQKLALVWLACSPIFPKWIKYNP